MDKTTSLSSFSSRFKDSASLVGVFEVKNNSRITETLPEYANIDLWRSSIDNR